MQDTSSKNTELDSPDAAILSRIESLIKCGVTDARKARGGYGAAQRWIMKGDSGQSFFAKIGTPPVSSQHVRDEAWVYERVQSDCIPRILAWQDDADYPIMLFEDLSLYYWLPPWTTTR